MTPGVIGAVLTGVSQIADDLVTTDEERLKIALQSRELDIREAQAQQAGDLAQIAANAEEAKSTNWFVAGARPFVIWVCAAALGYASIIEPIARFVAVICFGYSGQFPEIDTTLTLQMLGGLLGLSGLRSHEKVKGVAR